jgi:hypothetical protein
MVDAQDLVCAYTVKTAGEAEIIKNFLGSQGIACRIDGEGQVGLVGVLDIVLLVKAEDADRARNLILHHKQIHRRPR